MTSEEKIPAAQGLGPWRVLAVAAAAGLCLAAAGAPAGIRVAGKVFDTRNERRELLYTFNLDRSADGVWRSRYVTSDDKLAAEDELVWRAGEFVAYRYVRHVGAEASSVERRGPSVFFVRTRPGRRDEAEEPYDQSFVAGSAVIPYVQSNWSRLMAGERLVIRYGVLDLLRSFAFDLVQDPDYLAHQPGLRTIRMRARSPLVRLFAAPTYLVFSSDGQHLHALVGRTLPVAETPDGVRPVDAELIVTDEAER